MLSRVLKNRPPAGHRVGHRVGHGLHYGLGHGLPHVLSTPLNRWPFNRGLTVFHILLFYITLCPHCDIKSPLTCINQNLA